ESVAPPSSPLFPYTTLFRSWASRGACRARDVDPGWFDADRSTGGGEAVSAALEVCRGCPVRLECLIWAVEGGDWWSVAGGVEPVDRVETLMWECRAMGETADA